MRVLQINSYFAGSTFYEDLYAELDRLGVQEDIFVFTHAGNELTQTYPDNVRLRRPYRYLDRYIFPLKHRKVYRDLLAQMPVQEYALSHAHSLFSNGYIALKLKKEYGLPYIVSVRSADVNAFFRYAFHLHAMGREILREARFLVFLSEPLRAEMIRKYIDTKEAGALLAKSFVIPNGVNPYWRENRGAPKQSTHDPLRLLYVGNIDRNKNVLTTVKACEILRKGGRDVIFSAVGAVRDARVESALRASDFVRLHPFTGSREALRPLYRENDIYIMPSKTETFGITYVEAMSQGLPIIYTRGQGFDEQFRDGEVGFAVRHDRPREIADRILRIEEDYAGFSARALDGLREFDWEVIARELLAMYRRAARRKGENHE